MSEDMTTPTTEVSEVEKEQAGAKGFIRKYAYLFHWLPVALGGLLGLVLFLAPLGYLLSDVFALLGINFTGYGAFQYMNVLESGFTIPVIVIIVVGGLSVLLAAAGAAFYKVRSALSYHVAMCFLTVAAFVVGVAQAGWISSLNAQAGAFPIVCIVFGIFFALLAVGGIVVRSVFIATADEKKRWKVLFNRYKAWLYLSPALIILAVFTVYPIFNTIRMSLLTDYDGLSQIGGSSFQFGVENFANVARYKGFLTCLSNTLLLTVLTVPISTMLALLIAVALNSIKWVRKTMQTIFFLPYVTNSIAIGMVFMAMFSMIGGSATMDA